MTSVLISEEGAMQSHRRTHRRKMTWRQGEKSREDRGKDWSDAPAGQDFPEPPEAGRSKI